MSGEGGARTQFRGASELCPPEGGSRGMHPPALLLMGGGLLLGTSPTLQPAWALTRGAEGDMASPGPHMCV